jgi:hypothetical protein
LVVHRTQLWSALLASLWLAAVIRGQAPSVPSLSAELQAHLKNERLQIVTSVRGLPLGVRDRLQALFGSQSLDISESGADVERKEMSVDSTPRVRRRLIAAGCSYDHCLVYYERIAKAHTWHATLFHWSPEVTSFEWGGTARDGLRTIDDVRAAALSGAIKGSAGPW